MSYYRTCPDCGAHLDPGERCDCREEQANPTALSDLRKNAPVSVTSTDKGGVENIEQCISIYHDNRELEKLQV